jgi:hypothetical protein
VYVQVALLSQQVMGTVRECWITLCSSSMPYPAGMQITSSLPQPLPPSSSLSLSLSLLISLLSPSLYMCVCVCGELLQGSQALRPVLCVHVSTDKAAITLSNRFDASTCWVMSSTGWVYLPNGTGCRRMFDNDVRCSC